MYIACDRLSENDVDAVTKQPRKKNFATWHSKYPTEEAGMLSKDNKQSKPDKQNPSE